MPQINPHTTLLGLTAKHIPKKYQYPFLPSDLILFRSREPPVWQPVRHVGICRTCILDHTLGVLVISTIVAVGDSILRWAARAERASIVSPIASVAVSSFLFALLCCWAWLIFCCDPLPDDTSMYYHPYDKLLCVLFGHRWLADMYNFWHGPFVFRRFYRSLHGSSLVSWFFPPSEPSHIPIATRMEHFDDRSLLLRLFPYPRLFNSPWLAWLNEIYLTYRDWQRWEAAGQAYAELEFTGRLRAPPGSEEHIPLHEYSIPDLEEETTWLAQNGCVVFLEVDTEYHTKHIRRLA